MIGKTIKSYYFGSDRLVIWFEDGESLLITAKSDCPIIFYASIQEVLRLEENGWVELKSNTNGNNIKPGEENDKSKGTSSGN